jgi:hypothetical protein
LDLKLLHYDASTAPYSGFYFDPHLGSRGLMRLKLTGYLNRAPFGFRFRPLRLVAGGTVPGQEGATWPHFAGLRARGQPPFLNLEVSCPNSGSAPNLTLASKSVPGGTSEAQCKKLANYKPLNPTHADVGAKRNPQYSRQSVLYSMPL